MTTGKEKQKWEMKTALHATYFSLVCPFARFLVFNLF